MTTAVAFDFEAKQLQRLQPEAVAAALADGRQYCWLDFDDIAEAARVLPGLEVEAEVIERIEIDQQQGQMRLGRSCIHCTLVETGLVDGNLCLNTVHVVLGKNFIATVHAGSSALIAQTLETYEDDFYATAESGGFLLFELADHLINGYRTTLVGLSSSVDGIQHTLLGDIGDEILTDVSELTRALLEYRNAVVAAREAIDELATRRSAYVQASTQPFLERQTVPLQRLAGDAATERTVLSESLNLYMGIVSHRTNKVVNRLTVVSMIFLPLNFLAAVYGMNFKNMPELEWHFGYYGFWALSFLLVALLLIILRRRRWI